MNQKIHLYLQIITFGLFVMGHLEVKAYPRITQKVNHALEEISQDCYEYIDPNSDSKKPLVTYDLEKVKEKYLTHYYSPWTVGQLVNHPSQWLQTIPQKKLALFNISKKKLLQYTDRQNEWLENSNARRIYRYQIKPYFGPNGLPNHVDWAQKVEANIDWEFFPNIRKCGIIVRHTPLKTVPTKNSVYADWQRAGEGYPFNYLQVDLLGANEPCFVFHSTLDGVWSLVLTKHRTYGWVQSEDLAFVDPSFMHEWKLSKHFVSPVTDSAPLYNQSSMVYLGSARMGQLFPLHAETSEHYEVMTATRKVDGYAQVAVRKIDKNKATKLPLLASAHNIAQLANNLVGKPYGWGGIGENRECSMTLRDLFVSFGIFLPRTSGQQSNCGKVIPLEDLKSKEKKPIIASQCVPFGTLYYMPGHIMLGIGQKDSQNFIFHTIWGIRTKYPFMDQGRAVIGRTAITPLEIGKQFWGIPLTFLDKVVRMTLLTDLLENPPSFEDSLLKEVEAKLTIIEEEDLESDEQIYALASTYRDFIRAVKRDEATKKITFYMKNETAIPWHGDIDKTYPEKVENPDLKDMFAQPYPLRVPHGRKPQHNEDPGRYRHQEFLQAVYGETEEEIRSNLKKVRWMPKTLKVPKYVVFNRKNGAAAALAKVSQALDELPEHLKKYVTSTTGTFNWRVIAGTERLSPHSYGIAIDINTQYSNYWRWDHPDVLDTDEVAYRNQIPEEIVRIFEDNHFIWGGKWYHYDTMHFEYRPEFFTQHKPIP